MSLRNTNVYHGTPIGRRIHVIGNSCSGKSSLGKKLAASFSIPFVELDALNWDPGWIGLNEKNPEELERRISKATEGCSWIVAGSYARFSQRVFWPRLETVIWLDLPMYLLIWRVLMRSWVRWRTKELLWGTNYESFWRQLKVWNKEDSLLWWIVTQHQRKRRRMREYMGDSRWRHISFLHLQSASEVEEFQNALTLTSKP